VAWFFGATNLWKHLAYGIGLPWPLILVSFLVPAIVFALGVLFVRSFLRRGAVFLAAIAFPFYWVSYEFLSASISPHSSYGNLAYTQDELSASYPNSIFDWNLGHQLCCLPVCRSDRSPFERGRG